MKIEEVIKYPKLSYSLGLYPDQRVVLGKLLFWTEKVDGSNCRCFINEKEEIQFGSRNLLIAGKGLLESIQDSGYVSTLKECLVESKEKWNSNLIIFFEILQKGKSPTRTEFHDKSDIRVFDIYSLEVGWLNYTKVHQICYQYKLPIVDLWGISNHVSLKTLNKFEANMLRLAKKKGREGVVAKHYHGFESLFFKCRLDVPQLDRVKIYKEDGRIELPSLPKAEVMNEVQKVLDDIGIDKFKDVKITMPLIAQYVSRESRLRLCSNPKNLYSYYLERLEYLENEN
ncbi:MAG: hypothetical protein KAX49_03725 [Halanaerobiales bacterium]|nr:hypothetical protein [Halanaerobiales bacterium]